MVKTWEYRKQQHHLSLVLQQCMIKLQAPWTESINSTRAEYIYSLHCMRHIYIYDICSSNKGRVAVVVMSNGHTVSCRQEMVWAYCWSTTQSFAVHRAGPRWSASIGRRLHMFGLTLRRFATFIPSDVSHCANQEEDSISQLSWKWNSIEQW